MFDTDNSYNITNSGPAKFSLDRQAKTITITIKKGVKWSDGKQVVAKDVEYAYEVIANRATNSAHYTSSLQDVVGLKAYHDGQAKTISGIEMPDGENGRKVVIHFLAMHPGDAEDGEWLLLRISSALSLFKERPF